MALDTTHKLKDHFTPAKRREVHVGHILMNIVQK